MHRLAFCMIVAGALVGCGPSNPPQVAQVHSVEPDYPAMSELFSMAIWHPVQMNADSGNWPAAREALTKPELQDAFEAFEKEPMPGKSSTPEREAARTDAIRHIKAAIDGAKSDVSDADLKASLDAANDALLKMVKPVEPK